MSPEFSASTHPIATDVRSVDGARTYMSKRLTMGGGCLLREPFGGKKSPPWIEKVSRIALSIPRQGQVP